MKGIMIQGTSSDVGKSMIGAGFCRIFAEASIKVAPFKSQNVTNETYITENGKEIAYSQAMQAEAAGIIADASMNPILLKPQAKLKSTFFLYGEKVNVISGKKYQQDYYNTAIEAINASLKKLEETYDMLVIEGAGSPVEMNLHEREVVNMKVAEIADVPVILVADIERGGVFANIVGTLALFTPDERARVKGIIINKFRGDPKLFAEGVTWLEKQTGIPILGVLPYLIEPNIETFAKMMETYVDLDKLQAIIDGWERER